MNPYCEVIQIINETIEGYEQDRYDRDNDLKEWSPTDLSCISLYYLRDRVKQLIENDPCGGRTCPCEDIGGCDHEV